MTCWLDSSGRETDYLVAGSFLNLPQVGKYRGKIAGMLMSMFQAMSSDFLYNRVLHLSTSNSSSGDMKAIFRIFRWHGAAKNNLLGQRPSLVVDVKCGETLNGRESLSGLVGITFPSLLEDKGGNVRFVLGRKLWPDSSRGILVTRYHDVTAWPGCEVANDGCF